MGRSHRPPRHTETDSIRAKTPIITLCCRERLYRCAKYPQPPSPPPVRYPKIFTHVYMNAEIHFIYLQMHNEAQKQAYYPFSKVFQIQTIMDKSPWDSQNATSIPCVSQVLSQKAALSFYKSMSPPPSPPNTIELYLDGFNTLCGVGEGVGTYSASSERVQFHVC